MTSTQAIAQLRDSVTNEAKAELLAKLREWREATATTLGDGFNSYFDGIDDTITTLETL